MSIADHGSDSLAWVCRWSNGLRSSSRPWIHIFAGENVCIHAITPMQRSSRLASRHTCRMRRRVDQHRLPHDVGREAPAATRCSADAPRLRLDLAQRAVAVHRLTAGQKPDLAGSGAAGAGTRARVALASEVMACPVLSMRGPLPVLVLVAVVESVDVGRRRSGRGRPSWRAMCTLRATSSHITAALTASLAVAPDREHAVVLEQDRVRAMVAQRVDDRRADLLAADAARTARSGSRRRTRRPSS